MATFSKFAGLHTSHNYVGSVPDGAMSLANNCVITSQDTVEPRRGQYPLSYSFSGASNALFVYGTTLIAQYGTSLTRDTGVAFDDYTGTFTPVDDALCRMRGIEAAQNLYVNTATGVRVLDAADSEFTAAGVPQCLDLFDLGGTLSASGFLTDDSAVAYRAVIGQRDSNGRWHYGAPSQRIVVVNTPVVIAVGDISRNAGTTVTVSLGIGNQSTKYLSVGDTVDLTTNEADFVTGTKTVTAIAVDTFTYTEVGADVSSTIEHSFTFGARSQLIAVGIPDGVTSSDVIQLFRTDLAPSATVDPGDEVYQVAEINPPAPFNINAGGIVKNGYGVTVTYAGAASLYVGQVLDVQPGEGTPNQILEGPKVVRTVGVGSFTYLDSTTAGGIYNSLATQTFTARTAVIDDSAPETFFGDPLYTNPNTGEGIEASAYEPPIGKDMTRFGERMWLLNTTHKHTFDLQILGVGSPDGIQAADTITFTVDGDDYAYTASAGYPTTVPGTKTFQLHDYDTSAVNIERTALELVRCINQSDTDVPFYAVYMSAADDFPGLIQIREKAVGGSPIYVTASREESWNPPLPTSGETVYSLNDANPAGVVWSDTYDIESFPLGNALTVGDRDDPIYRGIGLRDSLFVFKKRGGVHVIPNQYPFRPRELDPTVRLRAPDTVVALNNQIYALSDQGLVTVTESGVDVVGWPLDYDFRSLLNTAGAAVLRESFAVAYESERQLWLWLPASASDTYATQAYIYNHATRAFTRAPLSRTCGIVMPATDILWMGSAASNTLIRERKSFDETDYADGTASVTLSAISDTTLTLSSVVNVSAGDVLELDGTHVVVTEIDGTDVTVSAAPGWSPSDVLTVYQGYTAELATVPLTLSAPGTGKAIPSAVYSFRDLDARYAQATIATDEEPAVTEYTFASPNDGWGQSPWGSTPWGDLSSPNRYVAFGANGSTVTLGLKVRQAWATWKLIAITAQMDAQSDRGR